MHEIARTQVGISHCAGEQYLKSACSSDSIVALDVSITRGFVQNGVTVEDALIEFDRWGQFRGQQRIQLVACLGRISRGECASYPLSKISTQST